MYSTQTIIYSLGIVAIALFVLVGILLLKDNSAPRDRIELAPVTQNIVSHATSTSEPVLIDENTVSQEEVPTKELPGSDFNMEFPTLDEGVALE